MATSKPRVDMSTQAKKIASTEQSLTLTSLASVQAAISTFQMHSALVVQSSARNALRQQKSSSQTALTSRHHNLKLATPHSAKKWQQALKPLQDILMSLAVLR